MRIIYRIKQFILIGGDLASFLIALGIALTIRHFQLPVWSNIEYNIGVFAVVFLFWLTVNYINGLYDLSRLSNDRKFYRRFFESGFISLIASIIFFYLVTGTRISPKTILILTIFFGYGLSALWRYYYNRFVGAKKLQTNIVLIGATPETYEIIDVIQSDPKKGYKIAAFIDPDHTTKGMDFPNLDIFHGLHTIRPVISTKKAHLVVIAPHLQKDSEALRELYQLLFWDVRITDTSSFYEIITGRITPTVFSEGWFLEHLKNKDQPIYNKFRILVDFVAGITVGIIFLILFPFIALSIKIDSKGPILFKQKRVGKDGNIFEIYKFRSMYALSPDGSAELDGFEFATKGDKRVTKAGKIMRKTRLDELPQFINLLKRDLTLVGPRPERPEITMQLEAEMPYYPLRHIVRPGLTGWAVIHQSYTDTLKDSLQKLQYDLYYIKNRSALLDLSILLRTINVVMRMMGQ